MNYPKILVGAPVCKHYDYCLDKYLIALKNFDYPNYDILLIDNSDDESFYEKLKSLNIPVIRKGNENPSIKMKMIIGRNYLREKVLNEKYEWFFNLDQDVIPPKDTLKKLISHDKKVITGIYYNYFKVNEEWKKQPILYRNLSKEEINEIEQKGKEWLKQKSLEIYTRLEGNKGDYSKTYIELTNEEVEDSKLIEVVSCGTGCIMIHRSILEKLDFKFNQLLGFDDVIFCDEVRNLLHEKVWCDTSIKCEHLIKEKPWSWFGAGNQQLIIYGAQMLKRSRA